MQSKVLLVWFESKYITKQLKEIIQESAGEKQVIFTTDSNAITAQKDNIEVVLGNFPRHLLSALPNLKWFQQFGTGVEWLNEHSELVDAPFILTNCSDDHYLVVADQMFALILSMARSIPRFVLAQQNSQWDCPEHIDDKSMFQLRNKTMLVVGLGSIGKELIKRGKVFGMHVIGVRKNSNITVDGLDRLYSTSEINIAASQADIVAACLPDTSETANIFDQYFFDAMKTSGYFYNVGRGTTVNESALEYSLKNHVIAGAGLDVFTKEPLNKNSSLWKTPNLLITPHTGGFYNEVIETWINISLDNLKNYDNNRPLRNLVNKKLGY